MQQVLMFVEGGRFLFVYKLYLFTDSFLVWIVRIGHFPGTSQRFL